MTTPYTYLLGWQNHNKYYYGVRYARNCSPSELMITYETSSKYVKEFISKYGNPDIVQIRKVFASKDEARKWEHKVLRRMKAMHRSDFLNETDNISISCESAYKGVMKSKENAKLGIHPNKGKKRPHLTLLNQSRIGENNHMFGRTGPMKGRFGKDSPNYGKKFPNRAKPKTEICIYCGINTITTNIRRWHNDKCNQNKNKETKS